MAEVQLEISLSEDGSQLSIVDQNLDAIPDDLGDHYGAKVTDLALAFNNIKCVQYSPFARVRLYSFELVDWEFHGLDSPLQSAAVFPSVHSCHCSFPCKARFIFLANNVLYRFQPACTRVVFLDAVSLQSALTHCFASGISPTWQSSQN